MRQNPTPLPDDFIKYGQVQLIINGLNKTPPDPTTNDYYRLVQSYGLILLKKSISNTINTKVKLMGNLHYGIVLYSIEKDGCLNGVYTNERALPHGVICNEIAIKSDKEPKKIIGTYNVMWFDSPTVRQSGKLKIEPAYDIESHLRFIWFDDSGTIRFEGRGYKMNAHQIAAHYWKP